MGAIIRKLPLLVVLMTMVGLGFAQSDQGAGQDIKDAGHSTKKAAKKTAGKVKKNTKKATHKVAHKTKEGAQKVEDKTSPQPQ